MIVEHTHLQDGPQSTQQSRIRYYKYLHYLLTTMNITSVVIMVIEINTFENQLNKKKMDLHNNWFSSLNIQSEIVWLVNPGHTAPMPMALGQSGYLCHEALNPLMLI